jgi:hypothetical protein
MFLNPVINGYIPYTALKDGSVNLYDIFVLNELIKYKDDYDAFTQDEYEKRRPKK